MSKKNNWLFKTSKEKKIPVNRELEKIEIEDEEIDNIVTKSIPIRYNYEVRKKIELYLDEKALNEYINGEF